MRSPPPVAESRAGARHPVVERLGAAIAAGELAARERIVPEAVADELGVSRSVVREALRVLEAKGMVRPKQRTGTRVLPVTEWDVLDPDVIAWRIRTTERVAVLNDLEELRAAVEPRAARACCEAAGVADVVALTEAAATMRRLGSRGDLAGFTTADVAFHNRLLTASGNAAYRRLRAPFGALLLAREELQTLPHQISDHVLALHERIAAAVGARDPDAAESASRELVDGARTEALDQLRRSRPRRALGGLLRRRDG